MRLCPSCQKRRQSDHAIDTVHLCDPCFDRITTRYGGITRRAIADISSLYTEFGLPHAGPLTRKSSDARRISFWDIAHLERA